MNSRGQGRPSRQQQPGVMGLALAFALGGCHTAAVVAEGKAPAVRPAYSFPVTTNSTPYTRCLQQLASHPGSRLPSIAVGEVSDKTGQMDTFTESTVLTQGVSEMVMSALWRSRTARLVERYDLRIPLAELKMIEQGLTRRRVTAMQQAVTAHAYVIIGSLPEPHSNIFRVGVGHY